MENAWLLSEKGPLPFAFFSYLWYPCYAEHATVFSTQHSLNNVDRSVSMSKLVRGNV